MSDFEDDDTEHVEAGAWGYASHFVGGAGSRKWIAATVPLDLILFRDEDRAVWLSAFRATPDGIRFEMEARYRNLEVVATLDPKLVESGHAPPMPELTEDAKSIEELGELWSTPSAASPARPAGDDEPHTGDIEGMWSTDAMPNESDGLTVGLAFGGKWAAFLDHGGFRGEGLALWIDSAGSGGGHHEASVHCSDVPEGEVTFWVEWPHLGIERTETVVDGAIFQEAAARAELLWENDRPDDAVVIIN